ncbi:hypothetical protein [Paraburkholderia acidisoli]|uniref:Uncharacterized protein n=1 Tax=Paraburkholderia acidisoli TaxID=2571748 RepID=A0A7Z2GNN9_9BURK|nr:hypothetical protein [Paraburkholderia acidisoli]QGZ65142.1 hypothetical protein FAZ98_25535 [Paraburkholderia acidisoli]
MESGKNDRDFALLAVVVATFVVFGIVWKSSSTFGLDLVTGLKVLTGLAITAFLARISRMQGGAGAFAFGKVWPVLLGLVWISTWPAFDYWAAGVDYFSSNSVSFAEDGTGGGLWWDAWYTQMFGLAALVGGGYTLRKLLRPRY